MCEGGRVMNGRKEKEGKERGRRFESHVDWALSGVLDLSFMKFLDGSESRNKGRLMIS